MSLPAGYVLPLEPATATVKGRRWRSSLWPLRREHLYLIAGDSPLGLRLPLDSLPVVFAADRDLPVAPDPFEERAPLEPAGPPTADGTEPEAPSSLAIETRASARMIIHTALCVRRAKAGCTYFSRR
jgi:uncharacterized protein (DUF2126 family)